MSKNSLFVCDLYIYIYLIFSRKMLTFHLFSGNNKKNINSLPFAHRRVKFKIHFVGEKMHFNIYLVFFCVPYFFPSIGSDRPEEVV